MSPEIEKDKVLITMRKDYLTQIDALVKSGAAPTRSALVEKVIGSFLKDLKEERTNSNTALGSFVGFLLLLLGAAAVVELLGGEK